MLRWVRVFVVCALVLAACSSGDGGSTTTPEDGSGSSPTTLAAGADSTESPGSDAPASSDDPTTGDTPADSDPDQTEGTAGTGSTSTSSSTIPPTPTTKANEVLPPTEGSAPVTDDTTPAGGTDERPADALDVTVTSSQLFVIGGDTLYLVVEGDKAEACHVLGYAVATDGSDIEIDLWSVPDPDCTFPQDYKDSLVLGTYPSGSYTIFLLGNDVADVDL